MKRVCSVDVHSDKLVNKLLSTCDGSDHRTHSLFSLFSFCFVLFFFFLSNTRIILVSIGRLSIHFSHSFEYLGNERCGRSLFCVFLWLFSFSLAEYYRNDRSESFLDDYDIIEMLLSYRYIWSRYAQAWILPLVPLSPSWCLALLCDPVTRHDNTSYPCVVSKAIFAPQDNFVLCQLITQLSLNHWNGTPEQ